MASAASPAFSKPFKLMALGLTALIGAWFWRLYASGVFVGNGQANASNGLIWALAAMALIAYTLYWIYASRTTLTEDELTQTWIWDKRVLRGEIIYAKLVRLRGFEWLIAPRLYVKTLGKFQAFYACEPQTLLEFEKLCEPFQSA